MNVTRSIRNHLLNIITKMWHTTSIHKACYENDIGFLQAFLESNSDTSAVSARDRFGWTPLHVSVYLNRLHAVQLLLSKGADMLISTMRGHTPLHLACYRGNLEMVHLLICNYSVTQMSTR